MKFVTPVDIPQQAPIAIGSRLLLIGSCFSDEVGERMLQHGLSVVTNPFGTQYNPLSIAAAMERLAAGNPFTKDELIERDNMWHSWLHHSRFSAANPDEALAKMNQALEQGKEQLRQADVLIVTLGTIWVYEREGQVVSNCHKFPPSCFCRRRLSPDEVKEALSRIHNAYEQVHPGGRLILTVSPIRHKADGLTENSLSKAVLRIAADQLDGADYFPAYELLMDELRDYRWYADDMVHPSPLAVDYIWERFQDTYFTPAEREQMNRNKKSWKMTQHRPILTLLCILLLLPLSLMGAKPKKVSAAQRQREMAEARQVQANRMQQQEEIINSRIRSLAMANKPDEAYQRLIATLKDDIDAQNWEAALEKAEPFRHYFGQDSAYLGLMRTLAAPYDSTVTTHIFPTTINTAGSEYSPTLTGDANTIYFCGRYRSDNMGSEDIFVSHRKNGVWRQSRIIPELCTPTGNEAPEAISQDGQTMILFYNGRLYISEKTTRGWMQPQPLPKEINCSYWQADAILTADGRAILFAAKKQVWGEERESMNIFVSTLQPDGSWSAPQSLGRTINTPMDERSPVLHSDMKTLYFCSSGHSTLGGLDVFKTTRKYADSWTEWTEPVNLGKEINTTGDDCWYKITTDGTVAYYAKQTEGSQTLDLHWVTLPLKMRPEPVATISGNVTDLGGHPLQAVVVWEDLDTHEEMGWSRSDPETGAFFITLPEGHNYGYYVEKQGYWPSSGTPQMASSDTLQPDTLHYLRDIQLVSIREMRDLDLSVRINNVFFELDKDELLPQSISELKRVAAVIRKQNLKVEVSGHTDSRGSDEHNLDLSERRARAVREFLIKEGCHPDRLVAKGYGETKPLVENDTEAHMALNRRVEVRINK